VARVKAGKKDPKMSKFSYEVRVRYAETDRMGVSYYANYFIWFEATRTEFLRSLGVNYAELESRGIFLPVLEAQCSYLAPSTYDDLLIVTACVSEVKRTSLVFQYSVSRKADGVVAARGKTVHVFTDHKFKPVRIPDEVKRVVKVTSLDLQQSACYTKSSTFKNLRFLAL